jgi:hypothetical protein
LFEELELEILLADLSDILPSPNANPRPKIKTDATSISK